MFSGAGRKHIFSSQEKKMFLEILKRYSRIVECKESDGATLQAKNDAWYSITREFNASPFSTIEATNKQLRRLWMNLKQRQREAITRKRQHRIATGIGPCISNADIDPDIVEVAPRLIAGIDETFDSDTLPESNSMFDSKSQTNGQINEEEFVQQRHTNMLYSEYQERQRRAEQFHTFEMQVVKERLKEAKFKVREAEARAREAEAKAELSEMVLAQKRSRLLGITSEDVMTELK